MLIATLVSYLNIIQLSPRFKGVLLKKLLDLNSEFR